MTRASGEAEAASVGGGMGEARSSTGGAVLGVLLVRAEGNYGTSIFCQQNRASLFTSVPLALSPAADTLAIRST